MENDYKCEIIDKKLCITLSGNPTTGYEWSYKISDENVIKCVGDCFNSYAKDKMLVGVGGEYKFTFSAVNEGEADISFCYCRRWEKDGYNKIKTIKVHVSNGEIHV